MGYIRTVVAHFGFWNSKVILGLGSRGGRKRPGRTPSCRSLMAGVRHQAVCSCPKGSTRPCLASLWRSVLHAVNCFGLALWAPLLSRTRLCSQVPRNGSPPSGTPRGGERETTGTTRPIASEIIPVASSECCGLPRFGHLPSRVPCVRRLLRFQNLYRPQRVWQKTTCGIFRAPDF